MINSIIRFCLEKKLVVFLLIIVLAGWGLAVMPFEGDVGLPRDPVPVDAIPDIGENQQIVFSDWPGRSPQDVEDQVTYPLTVSLLGVPGVKTVRSTSMFGFSSIFVIFEDKIDFYWSRSRVLERLNTARASLPAGVNPVLGPDATPLGQVFWYTLEGNGFDPFELRTIQDWTVKYQLQSVPGVAEVGTIGGNAKEYQIDLDPEALRAFGITIPEIIETVRNSNLDVGANTIEINRVEYVIRGIGFIKSLEDLEKAVIKAENGVPITLGRVAKIGFGPASRRGVLDKEGAEAVGGVVVVRYGSNPLDVIRRVKEKIAAVAPGLPRKKLSDGSESQVKIVPFYDRTTLIRETLGTLEDAITQQILITIIVVIVMLRQIRPSLLISGLLPMTVLMSFIAMKIFGVDSNLMSLSGIAIAIGTIVDMGIILCENVIKHLEAAPPDESRLEVVYRATCEVGSAVLTAISTTVVSFLAVFTMVGPEGKLFKPLAYTKTFALVASLIVALTMIPPIAHLFMTGDDRKGKIPWVRVFVLLVCGGLAAKWSVWAAFGLWAWAATTLAGRAMAQRWKVSPEWLSNLLALAVVGLLLADAWKPLGAGRSLAVNTLFVALSCGTVLGGFWVFERYYEKILRFFLIWKKAFLAVLFAEVMFGCTIWLGYSKVFGFVPAAWAFVGGNPASIAGTGLWSRAHHAFPGLGREFMPPLDEGSYLLMPTTMPHASLGEGLDVLHKQNMAIRSIPEVEEVVGKIGRVESPLDPAPLSMIETVVTYKPEFGLPDPATGVRPRLWRPNIRKPDDIWDEIAAAARLPGTTRAPRLQPIAARIVMLQTGIRAPMGIRIQGKTLDDCEQLGFAMEPILKEVSGVNPDAVNPDRVVGKPYLEIRIDRNAIARYGIRIRDVQDVIEIALGGDPVAVTVEGRERFGIRVRYARELRDSAETIGRVLIPSPLGTQIPLGELSTIAFVRGPQEIRSENTFLVSYVIFDKKPGSAETEVVEAAQMHLERAIAEGRLKLPAGSSYSFIGSYQNQVRSEKTLQIILPISLFIIFLILYLQFEAVATTLIVFATIFVAWCGGFIMLWLYGQDWFMNFDILGVNFRVLFNMQVFNLSVAVWVGFIALFGIASDDGVVMGTYLDESFASRRPKTVEEIRETVILAGLKRIRPCLMTTATTILALLPILTSTGRGADVMIPMALPGFGGMCFELLTLFLVPVAYCLTREVELRFKVRESCSTPTEQGDVK